MKDQISCVWLGSAESTSLYFALQPAAALISGSANQRHNGVCLCLSQVLVRDTNRPRCVEVFDEPCLICRCLVLLNDLWHGETGVL